MKAAVMEGLKKPLVVRDVPDPVIDANGAVIRVEANGVCRSDWHAWVGDIEVASLPFVLGHEFVGVIEEAGKDVKRFKKGDRVIIPFSQGDGTCPECLAGHHNICDNSMMPGFHYWGGYGRYAAIPNADVNLVELPEEVSFEAGASIGCRFMTAYYGLVEQAKVRPGEWVAVHGCGGVGLSAIHIASAAGAIPIAVDIMPEKLEFAKKLGAAYVVNSREQNAPKAIKELTKGGAHVSVDALGISDTILNALLSLRKRGRHLQLGIASSENKMTALPTDYIVFKQIQFLGSLGMPAPYYPTMLQLVATGKLNPGLLVTKRISIEEAGKEIEAMTEFQTLGASIVTKW
ncbi:zinc-dependent alcohol dehydrogenase family protein [Scopulibacillus cellulosilyticus]|uniref:Zinc-dependent alcohol dehydrogenase family protein n=1 Tax=Scopulibacillus cellulosilyticus TaxID=2665665 RepID=A0ABW2PX58_9BACL